MDKGEGSETGETGERKLVKGDELVSHFQSKELPEEDDPDGEGRAFSTKDTYRYYLRNWIVLKWGEYELDAVKAVAVEDWLFNLHLRPTKVHPEGRKASRGTAQLEGYARSGTLYSRAKRWGSGGTIIQTGFLSRGMKMAECKVSTRQSWHRRFTKM